VAFTEICSGKSPLRRQTRGYVDNIKVDVGDREWGVIDLIVQVFRIYTLLQI
jgi:hypothetical protein